MKILLLGDRSFSRAVHESIANQGHQVITRHTRYLNEEVDLIVAAHYQSLVPRSLRDSARHGAIGYHPSLLPRHRGRDALRWTIRMGDPVAGGTVYWLDDGIDTGPILLQKHVLVRPDDDASSLWRRELFPIGVLLLTEAVNLVARGAYIKTPQDEACATYEPPWVEAEGKQDSPPRGGGRRLLWGP